MTDLNLEFIQQGKTGCVFATLLSKDPDKISWKRFVNPESITIPENAQIISYIFPGKTKEEVTEWALKQGMYIDITSKNTTGLRYKGENGISWVQYFGQDSHVPTRQTPNPELLFCVKLPTKQYIKVGFKGVLHLAHASVEHLKEKFLDRYWNASFKATEARIGHKPTILEAAKSTFYHE